MLTTLLFVLASSLATVQCLRSRIAPRRTSWTKLSSTQAEYALLFDCDGVIVETEELHRIAYNKAFEKFKLTLPGEVPMNWDVHYYDKLQNTVGGGKAKMRYFFTHDAATACGMSENPAGGVWPVCKNPYASEPHSDEEKTALIDRLQDAKTEFYCSIVENMATARPGVLDLMDAAIADPRFKVGICSAATKAGFEQVVNSLVGKERLGRLDVVLAGDDVKNKKPDPEIYNTARAMLGMDKSQCIVVEDSIVGLKAAKAAGMKCIITFTSSTAKEDFRGLGADEVLPDMQGYRLADVLKHFLPSEVTEDAEKTTEKAAGKDDTASVETAQSPVEAEVSDSEETVHAASESDLSHPEAAATMVEPVDVAPAVPETAEGAPSLEGVESESAVSAPAASEVAVAAPVEASLSQPETAPTEQTDSASAAGEAVELIPALSQPESVVSAEKAETASHESAHTESEAATATHAETDAAHPSSSSAEATSVVHVESSVDVSADLTPRVAEEGLSIEDDVTTAPIPEPEPVFAGWGVGFMRSKRD